MYSNIQLGDATILLYCKAKQRLVNSQIEGKYSTDWIEINKTPAAKFSASVLKLKSLAMAERLDIEVKDNFFRLYEKTGG